MLPVTLFNIGEGRGQVNLRRETQGEGERRRKRDMRRFAKSVCMARLIIRSNRSHNCRREAFPTQRLLRTTLTTIIRTEEEEKTRIRSSRRRRVKEEYKNKPHHHQIRSDHAHNHHHHSQHHHYNQLWYTSSFFGPLGFILWFVIQLNSHNISGESHLHTCTTPIFSLIIASIIPRRHSGKRIIVFFLRD